MGNSPSTWVSVPHVGYPDKSWHIVSSYSGWVFLNQLFHFLHDMEDAQEMRYTHTAANQPEHTPGCDVNLGLLAGLLHFILFCLFLKIYIFIWKAKLQRKGHTGGERSSIGCFTSQRTTMTGTGSDRSQLPGTSSGCKGPSTFAVFYCFLRELGWKWNSSHMRCWHCRQNLNSLLNQGCIHRFMSPSIYSFL